MQPVFRVSKGGQLVASPFTEIQIFANKRIYKHSNSK